MSLPNDLLPLTHRVSRLLVLAGLVVLLGWLVGMGLSRDIFAQAITEMKSVQSWSWQAWKSAWPGSGSEPSEQPSSGPTGTPSP